MKLLGSTGSTERRTVRRNRKRGTGKSLLLTLVMLTGCVGGEDGAGNERGDAPVSHRSRAVVDGPVTFYEHVAPLLYEHCSSCHRPGGVAPFSLVDYADAKSRSQAIATETARRSMPPWLPDTTGPQFLNERRLTDDEIELIRAWVEGGTLAGDSSAAPELPDGGRGWRLGEPHLVVRLPQPYTLGGGGGEEFRNFVIPSPLDETRYVRTVELRPSDPRVVHHAQIFIDRTGSARRLADRDPGPGFDGMLHAVGMQDPDGIFLGWTPGKTPFAGLDGLAWRLEARTDLVLMLHLRPRNEPVPLQVEVGLRFAETTPSRYAAILKLSVPTIDIAPGVSEYTAVDSFTLPVDVQVLSVYPHAHYLGRRLEGFARLPDGSTRTLIRIPDWDFNWQDSYRFAQPLDLPRGTVVSMRYTYDNSAENPQNPHRPPQRVVYGPTSTDEMGELLLQVLVKDRFALTRLKNSLRTHALQDLAARYQQRLRVDPTDADALQGLGLLLHMQGRLDAAVRHYLRALEARPNFAEAYNNLGMARAAQGRLQEALAAFRKSVELLPDNYQAHYNLALGLQRMGDWAAAAEHLRQALAARPEDAGAHGELGRVLARLGQIEEALEHWRQATRGDPDWVLPLRERAWALATHPDPAVRSPAEALELAQRAADLTGGTDARVLDVLAAAYAANGEFESAAKTGEEAAALARMTGAYQLADAIAERVQLYRRGRTYWE